MARKTVVQFVDDTDGAELGTEGLTLVFGIDGKDYEIDLSPVNADALRQALAPYLAVARVTSSNGSVKPVGRRRNPSDPAAKEETQAIRAWAREQGIEVSDRGRISAEIKAAYAAGH